MPALNDPRLLGAAGIVALVGLWLVWALARKVVRVGYFVIAFAAGTAIAWAISGAIQRPQPWPMLAAEGLAFAWAWSLFRSKVARVVSAIMLLTVVKLALTYAPSAVKDPKELSGLPGRLLKQAADSPQPAKK
jgi:hypothetical protein